MSKRSMEKSLRLGERAAHCEVARLNQRVLSPGPVWVQELASKATPEGMGKIVPGADILVGASLYEPQQLKSKTQSA